MKYFDEEDAITEYEKQLQKKDNEIERLKEEYMILQNASDKVEEEKDEEIERLNNDIKALFKENSNKEKVIKAQDNIIKEVREFIEWHYEDNKKFYKNKGIGLNYPECDYILEILDKVGDGK